MPMTRIALILLALAACQPIPAPAAQPDPAAVVAQAESRYGLPRGSLDKVWSVECSRQEVGGPACRNRSTGERGAFQMTRPAAADVGCAWSRLGTGQFAYEADCAAAFLALLLTRCKDIHRAQGAYNSGKCTSRSRYAREVAKR